MIEGLQESYIDVCPLCNKGVYDWALHLAAYHTINFQCLCGTYFASRISLANHIEEFGTKFAEHLERMEALRIIRECSGQGNDNE